MARTEPKLRPSMAWAEIELTVIALDSYIRNAVQTKQVTPQVVSMAQVKAYMESFKPAVVRADPSMVEKLLAQYGMADQVIAFKEAVAKEQVVEEVPVELTDDQRYDVLKLAGEHTYTEDDKVFMLNKGTMIMMQRAMKQTVKSEDL